MSYAPIPIKSQTHATKERVWGTETLLARTDRYSLKVLFYKAGAAGGLQYHTRKDESFYLARGEAIVTYDNGDGRLTTHSMVPGECFRIPPGAVHRFKAVTDCVVYEASTPETDDRVRMERWYGEPVPADVLELPSTSPEPERALEFMSVREAFDLGPDEP